MKSIIKSLKALGFKLKDAYDHDEWHTKVYEKGINSVDVTQHLDTKHGTISTYITESDELKLNVDQITALDKILNPNQ